MNAKRKLVAGAVGTVMVAASVLTAAPAMAEGSWSSSISAAVVGFQSRTWQDSNLDNLSTTVRFTTCSVTGAPSFTGTQVELWGENGGFPDQNVGNKSTTCTSAMNWGRVGNNAYHFRINTINGLTDGTRKLTVNSVVTNY